MMLLGQDEAGRWLRVVLATTHLYLPASNWTELGPATEISPGHFQFIDSNATNRLTRFYRVRTL